PEDVDKALAYLRAQTEEATKRLQSAAQRAGQGEERDAFSRSLALVKDFAAVNEEMAKAELTIIASETARKTIANGWTQPRNAFLASPALATAPNRREIEALINEAHLQFFDARVTMRRYSPLEEPAVEQRMWEDFDKAFTALEKARGLAADQALAEGIERLSTAVRGIKTSTQGALDQFKHFGELRQRGGKVRGELEGVIGRLTASALQNAAAREDAAGAAITRAGHVGLGAGVLVALVMIGSAGVPVVGVARA